MNRSLKAPVSALESRPSPSRHALNLFLLFGGLAGMAGLAAGSTGSRGTWSGHHGGADQCRSLTRSANAGRRRKLPSRDGEEPEPVEIRM